jgi:hypothetical protein
MRYRRSDGVLHQVVEGRAMLIPPSGKEVVVLNGTGSVVWEALAEGGDTATLVDAVRAVHPDVDDATVTRDVAGFLAELETAGLIATS